MHARRAFSAPSDRFSHFFFESQWYTHTEAKTVLFIGIIFRQGVKLLGSFFVYRFISLVATLDLVSSLTIRY